MNNLPVWPEIEETLFNVGKIAIMRFAKEHPQELCSFFAYAWMVIDGDFSICFDTSSNALRAAKANEHEAMERRERMLGGTQAWRNARYFLTNPHIVDYTSDIDLFAYPLYEHVQIDSWNAFATNEALPKNRSKEDTYLEGNVQLIIWKVFERLIKEELFNFLSLASPFRLGYQFHDQELVVLRILNWPKV